MFHVANRKVPLPPGLGGVEESMLAGVVEHANGKKIGSPATARSLSARSDRRNPTVRVGMGGKRAW